MLSQILTLSSPVFKSMLGPSFKEGHTLAAASTIELSLPEDDPRAMAILCHILHLRNHNVSLYPSAKQVLDVAQLADKYDCTEAAMLSAHCWITGLLDHPTTDTKTRCTLLLAAYYFQHSVLLKKIAYQLITRSTMEIQIPDHLSYANLPETMVRLFSKYCHANHLLVRC